MELKHLSSNIKKLINKIFIIFMFLLVQFLIFRMNKQLNALCNFQDSLLVCELTGDAVEVVLKVKTRWGKHTLIHDRYNRTECSTHGIELMEESEYIPEEGECPDIYRAQTQIIMTLRATL